MSDDIHPDTIILRRIPASHYNPSDHPPYTPHIFRPNKNDTTGVSVYIADDTSVEECAALGRTGNEYYVAKIRARDIFAIGLDIERRPIHNAAGHAEIIGLTFATRREAKAAAQLDLLDRTCFDIVGPLPGYS